MDYNAGGARYNNTYIQFVGLGSAHRQPQRHPAGVLYPTAKTGRRWPNSSTRLDQNFAGQEKLRQRLLNRTHKYGNDDDYADEIMTRVFDTCFEELDGRPEHQGRPLSHRDAAHHLPRLFRRVTGATPDGRQAGLPVSEGISPVQGADRHGPTAVIRSAAKMDHLKDRRHAAEHEIHPGLVASEDGMDKWAHLVRSYFKMDGHHVQFNVVRAETLREAQANPETASRPDRPRGRLQRLFLRSVRRASGGNHRPHRTRCLLADWQGYDQGRARPCHTGGVVFGFCP